MKTFRPWVLILCLGFSFPPMGAGAGTADRSVETIAPNEILVLGPISTPLVNPLETTASAQDRTRQIVRWLTEQTQPYPGLEVSIFGEKHRWTRKSSEQGRFQLEGVGLWVASLGLEAGRWASGRLEMEAPKDSKLFFDGEELALKSKQETGLHEGTLKMTPGTHHLLIMGNFDEEGTGLSLKVKGAFVDSVRTRLDGRGLVSGQQLYGAPNIRSLSISPGGDEVLLAIRSRNLERDTWETVLELRSFEDARLIRSWTAGSPANLSWSPDGRWMSYTVSRGDNTDLWVEARHGDPRRRLIEGAERIGGFRWTPDSSSILFHWTRKSEPRKDGLKRYRGLPDRWTGWRNRAQVFQVDAQGGWIRQLTRSDWSSRLEDINPDGKTALITESRPDYKTAPYQSTLLQELDLKTGETRTLKKFNTFNQALYWGDRLLVTSGPSAFDGIGKATKAGRIANDYDTQLFLWRPGETRARPLSKDFDPAIGSIQADFKHGRVLLSATDQSRVRLFSLDVEKGTYRTLPSRLSVVESFDYAEEVGRVLWKGTSPIQPQQVWAYDLKDEQPRLFAAPAQTAFDQTRFGKVEDWDFRSSQGDSIRGRYYTPPDFDPGKRYPMILYYYGGTTPVTRGFSSRYPWNLWTANGYVVYVLQPSGAIGFGQEFSARHVNAWGDLTADEIMEGARLFVEGHPFVDGDRIGCIGASYGGFMTMYLTTRTNQFAAAVSHAGISSLSSYWGEGWWGYLYSGIATQGTFPWNRPDFYVEHSPLFQADRIETPLLLLHGEEDTNVPIGESQQMYTALKLLEKEVELVSIAGENHQIFDWDKRMVWWNTILAFFDRELKDQPEWWNDIFPESGKSGDSEESGK